jgi:hypothetical protein
MAKKPPAKPFTRAEDAKDDAKAMKANDKKLKGEMKKMVGKKGKK